MEKMREKIKSVMLAHAVADALGVPVEFAKREELDANPVTNMRGYGTYNVPAGAWSDDTSMSLAALDSLASGNVDYNEIMENFVQWNRNGKYTPMGTTFDVGTTCHTAIAKYELLKNSATACGLVAASSNGNGSLMRIQPFVLMAFCRDLTREACDDLVANASSMTHAHARSVLGCQIYATVLRALLEAPSADAVKAAIATASTRYASSPEYAHYARIFAPDFEKLPREQIKSSGYVVDTLEAAIWCLLTTDNFRDCTLKAVNLGSDTDTVAAVAGGLAGALYGYESIPTEWLDTLIRREYIEDMCERACDGWQKNSK